MYHMRFTLFSRILMIRNYRLPEINWLGFFLRLAGAGLLVGAIFYFLGGAEVQSFQEIQIPFLGVTLLLYIFRAALDAARWVLVVNYLYPQTSLPLRDAWLYFTLTVLLGEFTSPAISNTLGRAMLLQNKHGITMGRSFITTIYPRIFDLLILALLTGPSLLWMFGYFRNIGDLAFTSAALLTAGFLFVSLRPARFIALINAALDGAAAVWPRLGRWLEKYSLQRAPDERMLRVILVMSIVHYISVVFRVYYLVQAFSIPFSLVAVFFALPLLQLSMLAAFAPGALGSLEFGWTAVMLAGGVPNGDISSFLVWNRVFQILFAVVSFGVAYLWYLASAPRHAS